MLKLNLKDYGIGIADNNLNTSHVKVKLFAFIVASSNISI